MPAAYFDEIQLLIPIANIYNVLANHPMVLQWSELIYEITPFPLASLRGKCSVQPISPNACQIGKDAVKKVADTADRTLIKRCITHINVGDFVVDAFRGYRGYRGWFASRIE